MGNTDVDSTVATVVATVKTRQVEIPANQFDEYKKLKAEIASRERETKKFVELWEQINGLPFACSDAEGEYVIVNGNRQEIGKVTVSWRAPEVKLRAGFWTRRIS